MIQKAFTQQQLKTLIDQFGGPLVSIYMPTHTQGADIEQDPIRLKNMLREAGEKIQSRYPQGPDPEDLLEPAWSLVQDREFWRHQNQGLALFISDETFDVQRLPISFEERAEVGERYHVTPLLPLLSSDGEFFLLALSLNDTHLYQGARGGLAEVNLPEDTPLSLEEALKYDDPEATLQFHTSTSQGSGDRRAMFYGQGVDKADERANIRRFFHKLSDGVEQTLADSQVPLLLAGVEYLLPIYRKINKYPHLLSGQVTGNPQEMDIRKLHQKALDVVLPEFAEERQQAIAGFKDQINTERTTDSLEAIVPAAESGQIDTLFVRKGAHQWGRYDASTHQAHLHEQRQESSIDLIDLLVQATLENGGRVYLLSDEEMPIQAPAAALFRYTIGQEV